MASTITQFFPEVFVMQYNPRALLKNLYNLDTITTLIMKYLPNTLGVDGIRLCKVGSQMIAENTSRTLLREAQHNHGL